MRSPTPRTIASARLALTRLRIRFAHLVLLPDLTADDAHALRLNVRDEGRLTAGYALMSALSAGIAILGLLQSSVAVVIGAMLISPLMGPIAALGFGFASLDGKAVRESAKVVAVGAAIGITTGVLLTWLSPIRNATTEIIARTQPTLLDLAIALLSGIAGGYATVRQKGGTAIGVAIATALMPPLATVGYGLGVMRLDFAGGAMLLFLTNLAAIAFSFAVIARLSGAARPIGRVELTPAHVVAGIISFLALATPLGLTLTRVAQEADARSATRAALTEELGIAPTAIAQLDVTWPLFEKPSIDAVVISRGFRSDAQLAVGNRLRTALGQAPILNLQQVVAADIQSQTRAMIDAAMERNAAGIAKDVPPYAEIQASLGLPLQSLWVNRQARIVNIVPAAVANWSLADYREKEAAAQADAGGWNVHLVPPVQTRIELQFPPGSARFDEAARDTAAIAIWAMKRWGLATITVEAQLPSGSGRDSVELAQQRIASTVFMLAKSGIVAATRTVAGTSSDRIGLVMISPSPSELRAQAKSGANSQR